MCDPSTIAGAVLTAGGVAANSIGASQAESATNRALAAHQAKQQALREEAAAVQQRSQNSYKGFGDQQDQRAAELGTYLKQQVTPAATPETIAETTPNASNITVQEQAKQRGKATTFAQGQADALGDLRGFGDMLGTLSRAQARDAGQIGQIGGMMAGNSSVLPLSLDAASQAGNGWKTIGGLAGGVGKLGVSAGLSGMFGGAEAAAGAAAGAASAGAALPTFARAGAFDLGSVLSKAAPSALTLGTQQAALPVFARSSNIFSTY